jgi:uncharacterized protein (DUF2147 family)
MGRPGKPARKFLVTAPLLVAVLTGAAARAPEDGYWLTQDHQAVVAISPCGTGLCGRLVGLTPAHAGEAVNDVWGRSECGETIIQMPRQTADGVWHGTILDPRSGANWTAELWTRGGALRLRGFVGLPIFGGTQVWTVYLGTLDAQCRFSHKDEGGS